MILEFGFENYFSFKESVTISFRLDENCPKTISKGKNFSTVMGIKGANGSGKTQVLKGLSFLSQFCSHSFSYKPDDVTGVSSFFDSSESSEFYIEFQQKSSTYRYELVLNENEVKRETLYRTAIKKIKLFERIGTKLEHCVKAFDILQSLRIRKNASIISTANQYEVKGLKDVYSFFDDIFSNVFSFGHNDWIGIETASTYLKENKSALNFVKEFINECDSGISNITINKVKNKEGKVEHFPIFLHEANGVENSITDKYESSGTRSLYKWLPLYHITLSTGGILIVDEIDMHLHPHILPKIIKLFIDEETNPLNAQLIFATHDTEVLELLGRYRTYLVCKDKNESYAYRLDEIPGDILRNDRPIRPVYNAGRIGGVPKL